MTPREVNALLAHASLVDVRLNGLLRDRDGEPAGSQAVRVATEWSAYLSDVSYSDGLEAVRLHYASSSESLLPAHVMEKVAELRRARFWELPKLTPEEEQLCVDSGVPPEEFVERRDEPGWVDHLKSRWQGIES